MASSSTSHPLPGNTRREAWVVFEGSVGYLTGLGGSGPAPWETDAGIVACFPFESFVRGEFDRAMHDARAFAAIIEP